MTMAAAPAAAQTQGPLEAKRPPLATRIGHELNVSVQHYDYTEPLGEQTDVKMHAPKAGAEYTGTFALSQKGLWFAQMNLRATGFITNYDGSCRPWMIEPNGTSPNGYRLTLGAASPCSEGNDPDWYVEGRALAGKDFIGSQWAFSPFAGIGLRHLSNGTTGNVNFRTDEYLYIPVGTTLHNRSLTLTVEYDRLLRGWQKTRESLLTGGTVPATSTAPAFTIGDFKDLSFAQHHGWAFRASAAYLINKSWSIEPYYTRWRVGDSPVSDGSVAYTVNGITARQTLSYYEPLNFTNEFGVKVGFHFGGR
jgi:hypothetical protein